jgi:hypothetical protein
VVGRAAVPVQEERVLKAIFVGLCLLFVVAQGAVAATPSGHAARPAARARQQAATPAARLHRELAIESRARSTIRFFHRHPGLLHSRVHRAVARTALLRARRRLHRAKTEVALLERAVRLREPRRLRASSPRQAICRVFRDHCQEAVAVAWCESRLDTNARNGQYLGLFQMGTFARERFGHGPTAWEQATAAHRYYLYSGQSWSAWSCKPSHAYS